MDGLNKIMGFDVMAELTEVLDVSLEKAEKRKARRATPTGYSTNININGYEFDCIVDYEYIKGCKGSTENGVPMEPDEQPYIEMGQVYIFEERWELVDIPESAMKDTLDEILEHYKG